MKNLNNITTIAFDADDTLWINEHLFRITEQRFVDLLSEYVTDKTVIDKLYDAELRNLQHFGYGIKGFILSMIETAIELTNGEVKGCDLQKFIDWGKDQINHPVHLISGVEEVLNSLQGKYKLILITKGDLFDQESKIARSGLASLFNHIEIVSEKNKETYSSILLKYNINPIEFLMIGNSLKSDILPVLNIGGKAIYIPADTTWVHEAVSDSDIADKNYIELSSITKLIPNLEM
ncbi:MAG: HAD hydrolase-like protein [Ichthyobacteriaceae bacterium]|nr:HAD hydrolase-like protein [Ichthyobacteriaceae bacterium]